MILRWYVTLEEFKIAIPIPQSGMILISLSIENFVYSSLTLQLDTMSVSFKN